MDAILSLVPPDYIVASDGPLRWNLRSVEPRTHDIDMGWDLWLDVQAGRFELTHSNNWREEPMFFHEPDEEPTDKLTVPEVEPLSASYLPLTALDREGALLAFVLGVVETFPPNTNCATDRSGVGSTPQLCTPRSTFGGEAWRDGRTVPC